ncbi:RNA-directed DNA polymerase [Erysipelothrix anatis]|uniref:RNA-directed DNA polymerase n=1 Tax=Erysipelothrix anatis TaxID=2683713 RepID=UPI0013587398|nr:RNA-directed DNA polymerase [Erysipelothrix anatis]
MFDRINWDDLIRLSVPKLDKDNFISQIVEFGFFAEQFPLCFSSSLFSIEVTRLLPLVSCSKAQAKKMKNVTQPSTLSTRKDDITRRVLSLPNPKAFLRVAKYMQENWDNLQEYAESDKSLSPITYIHSYNFSGKQTLLNSENVRESYISKSSYIEGINNSIKASLGYKYRLKVDISNCYNSIYTHSISWAICGKNEAKKYMRTKEPAYLESKYEFSDRLDTFVRYMKNNETNGIVVGPFTSRIISEIILAAIDRDLEREGYVFRRYVDDYKFYFRTHSQAQESLPKIERVLNQYGLQLNSAKTQVEKYPYELITKMKVVFTNTLENEGVFGVLNEASLLYSQGEKGAYKYALKLIRSHSPNVEDFEIIMSSLINIVLIEPKYGRYVIDYLKKYMSNWKRSVITELVNHELSNSMKNELQEESLVFLQVIKELSLPISASNVIQVLNSNNDFGIIIVLDLWKNKKKLVVRTRKEAIEIGKCIKRLSDNLRGEEYNGSRWLLLYESKFHSLFEAKLMPVPEADVFFDTLIENGVTFYSSSRN